MSTAFYHRHDHAVIVFADTLQWTAALELVDTLDTLVELYFYALVELVVSSPGGDVRALHYVLDAMEAHRAQGVRIRTRVLSHAESAAAVLACLGEERIAEPGARLLFHPSRALDVASITASGASTLRRSLARTDDALVALLVERAMRGVDAERALEAEPLDRAALGELAPALARPARRRHRGLARALGAHVIAGVTRVRPVSALATGECYAILADGRFERRRLHPFTPHQPVPQRIESTARSPHDPTMQR